MKKTSIILAFILLASTSIGVGWSPTTASVKFYIKNAGVEVDGSLSGLAAKVEFDPNDLANSQILATVKVNTVNTGIEMRDNHLKTADYFDAKKYPVIQMSSTSFSHSGDNNYIGNFKLEMHGVTKTVTVPFTFIENDMGTFRGEFELDRLDYGVGGSSWVLGDEVKVKLLLNVDRKSS